MNQNEQRKKEMIATKIMQLELVVECLEQDVEELEFQLEMAKSQLKEERFNLIVLSVFLLFSIIVTSLALTL